MNQSESNWISSFLEIHINQVCLSALSFCPSLSVGKSFGASNNRFNELLDPQRGSSYKMPLVSILLCLC